MSKHTQGPWKIAETWAGTDGRSISIYPVKTGAPFGNLEGKHAPLAEVRLIEQDYSNDSLANAQLIAAAPELLSALKAAVADIDYTYPAHSGFWDTRQGQEILKWYNPAVRVINKAEGK